MQIPRFPFKILAIGPFGLEEQTPWSEAPIRIDKTSSDQAIQDLGISFYIPVPKNLCRIEALDVACKSLKDFHPDSIVQNNAFLKNLIDAKRFVEEAGVKRLSAQEIGTRLKEWPDLPPIQIATEHKKARKSSASPIDDILEMVALPEEKSSPPAETHSMTAQIDAIIKPLLTHIFSYEKFRNVEALWRGLRLLMQQGGVDGEIALEIVPASFETLDETLNNLTAGLVRDLPSLIVIDLPFDNSPRSLELLERIAEFSETLLVPTVCWITHKFLFLNSWQDLKKLPFLPHYLEEPPFAKWRRLRETSSARWLCMTCNRFLARYPYGIDNKPRLVRFEETRLLWTSPVWAVACLMGKSFVKTGWPTHFTQWQDTRLESLPLSAANTNKPLATEAHFAEERIDQFIRAGIMPLVAPYNQDVSFTPIETTVAGGSLSYQAFVSRVTQFILWCKDHFKKDLDAAELQKGLERAFALFWERSGHLVPTSLAISTGQPGPDDRIPLRIVIEPSRQILPSGEKMELEFVW